MSKLNKRPIAFKDKNEFTPENAELLNRWVEDSLNVIDSRRISQQSSVSHASGASDATKIENLTTAINNLIAALNSSDLTEE